MYYYFLFWLFPAGENAIGEDCWYNGGFVSHGEVVPDRNGCGIVRMRGRKYGL